MISNVEFKEASAQRRTESIPLAHLSIELGHLYAEDFGPGYDHLQRHFEQVAPWVDQARNACQAQLSKGVKARVSTCFLIDDYFNRFGSPPEVIELLLKAAQASGLSIDYIAREAGCAEDDGVPVAGLVVDRLVPNPPPNTTGGRPPAIESGWLCNGQRTPGWAAAPAMKAEPAWAPPVQNGANLHSIFVDVELWSEAQGRRTWSCAFLASVWQLVRLGLLRHSGYPVVQPYLLERDEPIPADWDKLPAVIQVNPKAAPFSAYRTISVLKSQFLSIELAVRTILGQILVEPAAAQQLATRSRHEGIALPSELIERIGYVFISE
jgi:hypothetical protein